MVSWHVEKRHIGAADDVLEIVEWQVATRNDEIRPELIELVAVKRVVDFVGDRENSRQARISRRTDSRAISAARAPSNPTSSPAFKTVAICGAE
jgi:hypothetical protein